MNTMTQLSYKKIGTFTVCKYSLGIRCLSNSTIATAISELPEIRIMHIFHRFALPNGSEYRHHLIQYGLLLRALSALCEIQKSHYAVL